MHQRRNTMVPTQVIEALRSEHFADDIELPKGAAMWSERDIATFFESGGLKTPDDQMNARPQPAQTETAVPDLTYPARVLCLHGGGGNKTINSTWMAVSWRA